MSVLAGLAAILGHQSQATCDLDPNIVDNEGQIEVMSETIYNVDFFNQHTVEEDKMEDTDEGGDGEDGCDRTCAYYFSI